MSISELIAFMQAAEARQIAAHEEIKRILTESNRQMDARLAQIEQTLTEGDMRRAELAAQFAIEAQA